MALITGTPLGVINSQDSIFIDTAPNLWFQDYNAALVNNPDGDGFYWGLTGTAAYPIYALQCYEDVAIASEYESNAIRCDVTGDQGQIQKLNHIDITFTLKTFFPLDTLTKLLRGGAVTTTSGATEKMGIGQPNNNQYWHVYGATVYDSSTGDYLNFTGHRMQFVDAWTISFGYAEPSTLAVIMRCFADTTLPAAQQFMTLVRADPSAIA